SGEKEGPETGLSSVSPCGVAGVEPVAAALALGAASHNERVAAKAEAYLEAQKRLSDLQIARLQAQDQHFHEEAELELSHLRLRRFSGYAKAAFEFSIGLIALSLVAVLGFTVWNAAHADGLIVESFIVPPDLAARGITGQVVASRMLDKLSDLQAATTSVRSAKSYANNWGDDLKVEIPETGVSIGEAWRFLRGWLGHETHISGEVFRTDSGIAITARSSGESGTTFIGPASGLDALVEQAAEHIYSVTQPYRYGWFLRTHGRAAEAKAVYQQLTLNSDPVEQSWAWHGLAIIASSNEGKYHQAQAYDRKALALYGAAPVAYYTLARSEMLTGHAEAALGHALDALRIEGQRTVPGVNADVVPEMIVTSKIYITELTGDFAQLQTLSQIAPRNFSSALSPQSQARDYVRALAHLHDGVAARAAFSGLPVANTGSDPQTIGLDGGEIQLRVTLSIEAAAALEDWRRVAASEPAWEKAYAQANPAFSSSEIFAAIYRPLLALAKAKLGDFAGAEAVIAATPGDCYDCIRIRGQIASEARQWGRADYWFARAVRDGPSIPFAHQDWGRSLLDRGKPDEAIAQFTLANRRGPHFADALEGWGEALMAKNQSHLALAKFAEAEKYAPNWGRLHLKWGEALFYAGKPAEAKAQFTRAAALDLAPSEKSELARQR
ncbi:MAG: hypothetical protein JO256_02160, partial [Alphaproteobacteria bacterium]|nr:hypothetical protein [Alphaproteobacteria bacterium]